MPFSGQWFIPGPVEVHQDVLAAMQRPVFHHRSEGARAILQRVQPRLRSLFRTSRPVLMQTASATALMEGAIRSGVKERVLCVVSGTFGERFADIAERCNKEVVRLHVPRGEALEPALLGRLLDGPPVDAVTMVHVESSTGSCAPLEGLLPLFRRMGDVVLMVDMVASVGATPVDTDGWGIDFAIGASQKALGMPPGLTFGVASERFITRAETSPDRGRYLDIAGLHSAAAEDRFPQTPAISLIHALDAQLERISAEGIPAREGRHRAMRQTVERWVAADGRLQFLAPEGRRADAVSALRLPAGMSAPRFTAALATRGWQITTGMEEEQNSVIRIGHMGENTEADVNGLLEAITTQLG